MLKERIKKDGKVFDGGILNVGSFLNQQVDIGLYDEIGKEFVRRFSGTEITRILTIEASGIGVAAITALHFKVPLVFAKKFRAKNLSKEVYSTSVTSFTHGVDYTVTLPKEYISAHDSVLIIDDFLANGCALEGLADLVRQANANVAGVGIVIEKGFQPGGKKLRDLGLRIESLAIIESMSCEDGVVFR